MLKSMQKLIPVEEAKALMTEAIEWSVWRWLLEKKECGLPRILPWTR